MRIGGSHRCRAQRSYFSDGGRRLRPHPALSGARRPLRGGNPARCGEDGCGADSDPRCLLRASGYRRGVRCRAMQSRTSASRREEPRAARHFFPDIPGAASDGRCRALSFVDGGRRDLAARSESYGMGRRGPRHGHRACTIRRVWHAVPPRILYDGVRGRYYP